MSGQSIQNTVFRLRLPDYRRQRDDRTLLVWKDIPHWMVVDDELKTFLFLFTNGGTLRAILQSHPTFLKETKTLKKLLREMADRGILLTDDNKDAQQQNLSEPIPAAVPIENVACNLTHRCNLRCAYCYYSDNLNPSNNDELSASEVIAFLKTLKPFLSKRATLTVLGGEPLLDGQKLIDVCRAARKMGITPLVSTNGTLINPAFATQARRIGLEVQVSVDGPTPEINDPLRGRGTFDNIQQGVSVLQSCGVRTILSMVCCRQNFASLEAFLNLAIQWRVQEARFIPLKQMGGAKTSHLESVSHYDIVTTAWRLLKEHPEYRSLLGRDCLTILANTCRHGHRKLSCGTGSQTLLLDADGVLYPCLNLNRPEFAFGHIRDKNFNFKEIWKNAPTLQNVRQAVSAEEPCASCLVCFWCLGGCRGETVANGGQLSARSIHCGDLRKTILEIFWILSESQGIIRLY